MAPVFIKPNFCSKVVAWVGGIDEGNLYAVLLGTEADESVVFLFFFGPASMGCTRSEVHCCPGILLPH